MAEILEAEIDFATANVTLTTTTETLIIDYPEVVFPVPTGRVIILAWGQLTTGAGTTTVTPRIRQGSGTAGTLVGEANAENVKAAAGSTEPFFIAVSEARSNVAVVQYSLTLAQVGATGDGTALQATILILVIGG